MTITRGDASARLGMDAGQNTFDRSIHRNFGVSIYSIVTFDGISIANTEYVGVFSRMGSTEINVL